MEIKVTNGYLFIDDEMINLKSIRKVKNFKDNQTEIVYNDGDMDFFEIPALDIQNAIINNAKYGEGFRPC